MKDELFFISRKVSKRKKQYSWKVGTSHVSCGSSSGDDYQASITFEKILNQEKKLDFPVHAGDANSLIFDYKKTFVECKKQHPPKSAGLKNQDTPFWTKQEYFFFHAHWAIIVFAVSTLKLSSSVNFYHLSVVYISIDRKKLILFIF